MKNLYKGTETRCPTCGGRIKHQYTGYVTSKQLDEDLNTCLWMEVADEGRSCLGFRPICRSKDIKKNLSENFSFEKIFDGFVR